MVQRAPSSRRSLSELTKLTRARPAAVVAIAAALVGGGGGCSAGGGAPLKDGSAGDVINLDLALELPPECVGGPTSNDKGVGKLCTKGAGDCANNLV